MAEGFQLSQYICNSELISKPFPKDTRTIELISSLGSTQPTKKNTDPDIKSREQKEKELVDIKKQFAKQEAERQKILIEEQKQIQKRIEDMQKFWKNQKGLLDDFAKLNPKVKDKYIDPKTKEIDPFFVLTESFKNVVKAHTKDDSSSNNVKYNTNPGYTYNPLNNYTDMNGYNLYSDLGPIQTNTSTSKKTNCNIF